MTGRVIMKCSRCNGKFSWDNEHLNTLVRCPLCNAITNFTRIVELGISRAASPYFNRGKAYMEERRYNKAIANFTKALDRDSHCASAFYYRGRCYSHNGENNRALADFNWLIEMDPAYASAYYYRGRTYKKKGNHEKTVSDMEKYLELEPDGEHAPDAKKIVEGARRKW